MLREVLLINLILCPIVITKKGNKQDGNSASDELGSYLITSLRDDKNLDLSMDEEYEDLRAELLAYHTALSSLTGPRAEDTVPGADNDVAQPAAALNTRRSMKTTPCWKLGGICVKHNLCKDTRFLTEVPGCNSNREVCCFTWNTFQTTDLRDKGIGNKAFPWTTGENIGGKGLIGPNDEVDSKNNEENDLPLYNIPIIFSSLPEKKKTHHSKRNRAPIVVIVKPKAFDEIK